MSTFVERRRQSVEESVAAAAPEWVADGEGCLACGFDLGAELLNGVVTSDFDLLGFVHREVCGPIFGGGRQSGQLRQVPVE